MNKEQRDNIRKLLFNVMAYAQVNNYIDFEENKAMVEYIADLESYRHIHELYDGDKHK